MSAIATARRTSTRRQLVARPLWALAAVASALVLASAGCGNDEWATASLAAKGNARSTVETWLTLCANENGEGALEPLTSPEREIYLKAPSVLEGCERVARLAPDPPPPPERLKSIFEGARIERVEVDAGFGTATVRSPTGMSSELDLELDRGVWQISHPRLEAP